MGGDRPNVRGLDHLGVVVPDLEQAAAFLEQALGAETLYDLFVAAEDGSVRLNGPDGPVDTELDFGGAKINDKPATVRNQGHRMMRLGDGATLELLQYDTEHDPSGARFGDLGLSHLAVYVDDIDLAAESLAAAGGKLYDRIPLFGLEADPDGWAQYAEAPWGLRIELVTYRGGAYEETTRLRRPWSA